jgi:UV DNA damage endonuclease
MKIGYPCINKTIECTANKTFRLKSYSEERLNETIQNNLSCLYKILQYNVQHKILFFRIPSDLIPFASHTINTYNWQDEYLKKFQKIGSYIKKHNIRITMHPDQFIILNAKDNNITQRSIKELHYHAEVLDLLSLDDTAKIQLHIGGVYNDKQASIHRFIDNYHALPESLKNRLVIENDHQRYHMQDCLSLSKKISIPVLFDYFHHKIFNDNKNLSKILVEYNNSWSKRDGIPLCDYSSQKPNAPQGAHAHSINLSDFSDFLEIIKEYDIDIMLEIKDKEKSALKAITIAQKHKKFLKVD